MSAVLAGALLLMLFGLVAAARLDIDVLPDLNRPSLVVMTEAPGLGSEDGRNRPESARTMLRPLAGVRVSEFEP